MSVVLGGCSGGCATAQYLWQAGKGQLELSNRAEPITEVVRDPRTPTPLKKLLEAIPDIKKFGEQQGLKATSNYTDYVNLKRTAAVWVVSACEPLKFQSREWSFPVVGSFTYLGWFDLDSANRYADRLREDGLDVDVRPARAYSTLGWFKDAVLSTMIPRGPEGVRPEALGDLVNVILHESVHATLYLKGQSYFNESLANFVAERLTPVYLERAVGKNSPEYADYLASEAEGDRRELLFHQAYEKLSRLYAAGLPAAETLSKKKAILDELRIAVSARREINNATLIQFQTYGVGKDEFAKLFDVCKGDLRRFLKTLSRLKSEDFGSPQREDIGPAISALAARGC